MEARVDGDLPRAQPLFCHELQRGVREHWRSGSGAQAHCLHLLRSGQAAGGGNGNSRQRRGRDGNSRRQGDTPRTCDQRWSCCEGCHPIYTGSQSSAEVHIPTISSRIPSSRGHSCGPKLCTGLDLRWLHWHLVKCFTSHEWSTLLVPLFLCLQRHLALGRLLAVPAALHHRAETHTACGNHQKTGQGNHDVNQKVVGPM
mmetsp:Transcript_61431/g.85458  ORF Transcript_61431/g.85458 Transcript_61431/m.85458 type:complete len:200 (-) Transcript_61431:9-608(-)